MNEQTRPRLPRFIEPYVEEIRGMTEAQFIERWTGQGGSKKWEETKETGYFEGVTSKSLRTLDEALEFSKADLETWEVDRHIFNSWDVSMKLEDGSTIKRTNYQVKVWFKKRVNSFDIDRFLQKLEKSIGKNKWDNIKPKKVNNGLLVVPHITDSHFGKVSFDEYGNINSSLKKTEKHYKGVIDDILSRININEIDRFLLPVGNDLINIDSPAKTTTAGTFQPSGETWENMLVCAENCVIEVVEILSKIAPVDVMMVRGNHDSNSTFTIGRTLWAYFKGNNRVNIINTGNYINYYTWNNILLTFLHGHTVKLKDIDKIIAHEAREQWGKAKLVECIVGHLHHENSSAEIIKLQENLRMRGVTVRIGDTFSGVDEWHKMKTYTDTVSRTNTFVYSKGKIEEIIYSYIQ